MNGDFFQNMAPNAKRSFFATVIFSALAVIIYLFCVQPSTPNLTRQGGSSPNFRTGNTEQILT